ncbi:MAG: hypothetical protein CVV52_10795 [Spirochaetae bacterium HGW-Spirochaetae-8]|jgi:two-component system phosphate regulon sensor histidine kinase PhoR|nr:MAG: hypothetical protein CVV52_10795 [Spirochaetae bacterium HGW-Spirochaetae-8]
MDNGLALNDFIQTIFGTGRVMVDEIVMRKLIGLVSLETLVILVALGGFAAFLFKRFSKSRKQAVVTTDALAKQTEKLRLQLDEMVRKTNDRNNYINSIFSSIEDGFMLVDTDNQVVLYNPRAMELLGLDSTVFFSDQSATILSSEPVATILHMCGSVLQKGSASQLDLRTDSGRILDVRVSLLTDKYRGTRDLGVIAIVKDITEWRRLENLKKDFVANVSHEFRTPLTLISGFMEMFEMQESISPSDRKRAYEIIHIETERLKRLVSELLNLSAIENSLPKLAEGKIDVRSCIADAVSSLGNLAEAKEQHLATRVRLSELTLRGNENWFYLMVKNLVENAIKYTPPHGSITIEAFEEMQKLIISVADTGIGIPAEELDKIFDRFYRVEKARGSGSGGSGLGLALVKDIVSIFHGEVRVESEVGSGSIFTVQLPL